MNKLFLLLALLSTLITSENVRSETWYDYQMKRMDKLQGMPTTEQLNVLGEMLNFGTKYPMSADEYTVFKRTQSLVYAIPGYADLLKDQIQKNSDPYGLEPRSCFKALQQLPSRETVKILGELILEETRMDEYKKSIHLVFPGEPNRKNTFPPIINSVGAAVTLSKMPLKAKPSTKIIYNSYMLVEDVERWKQWYIQIKEGRRTFSFEGDPNEYDLDGVALEAKNPDIPRATKRPRITDNASTESHKPSGTTQLPWMTGTIAAILAGLSWIVLKKRKAI